MKRIKRIIIIFIIIYFGINFTYNKIINSKEYFSVYALNRDIARGKNILNEDVYEVKISKKDFKDDFELNKNIFEGEFVLIRDLGKDQIITKDKLVKKEDYIFDDTKEMVAIPIQSDSKYIRGKLEKGSIINIYYIDTITNKVETVEENTKILDISNEKGESVSNDKELSEVILSLDKEKVLMVNSYKQKGSFFVSIIN